jgi:hypothetical protein
VQSAKHLHVDGGLGRPVRARRSAKIRWASSMASRAAPRWIWVVRGEMSLGKKNTSPCNKLRHQSAPEAAWDAGRGRGYFPFAFSPPAADAYSRFERPPIELIIQSRAGPIRSVCAGPVSSTKSNAVSICMSRRTVSSR